MSRGTRLRAETEEFRANVVKEAKSIVERKAIEYGALIAEAQRSYAKLQDSFAQSEQRATQLEAKTRAMNDEGIKKRQR